ncbi:MAG: hypothetical protein CMO80_22940 [Verrucomicrobiales bacterium]|nr:hypothetical protein [Verrucomicrobiales bacterium]|tara:strand:+ start:279 stop:659 length:381 start_codon:yes stop_codon:yes gene_type:complete
MSTSSFSRRWRFIFWLLFGLGLVILGFVLWDASRWRLISDDGDGLRWQRRNTTHWDKDRDGRADEISIWLGRPEQFLIQRDLDDDGWLDVEFESRSNIWNQVVKIHTRAPRHAVPNVKAKTNNPDN